MEEHRIGRSEITDADLEEFIIGIEQLTKIVKRRKEKKSCVKRYYNRCDSDNYSIIYSDSNTHAAIFLIFFFVSDAV